MPPRESGALHETYRDQTELKTSSDRAFGIVFAVVFAALGVWFLLAGGQAAGGDYKSPIKAAIKSVHKGLLQLLEGIGLEGTALGVVARTLGDTPGGSTCRRWTEVRYGGGGSSGSASASPSASAAAGFSS